MHTILSQKTMIILLFILLALVVVVASVSAADLLSATEVSALDSAIVSADGHGAEGVPLYGLKGVGGPISGTDHRLISPWVIDPGERDIF